MALTKNRQINPLTAPQQKRFGQASQALARGDLAAAEAAYTALLDENPRFPPLYSQMAAIRAGQRRYREAERLWNKALDLDPGYIQARYLLGNLFKSLGKLDRAAACYRHVMANQPAYTQAHFTFSQLHRYTDRDDAHLAAMLRLWGSGTLPGANRIHLAFALAKAFEDIGDYDESFAYLAQGNRLRSREFNYEISGDRDLFANIIDTFTPEAIAGVKTAANLSSRPVFIIGMPRSGTSLVEKILSSHPAVHGAGEIQDFYALAAQTFLDPADRYRYRPLGRCRPEWFAQLGQAYLERLSRLDDIAEKVTDKLPFNLLMAGLIRLSLPNAAIIHCRRDARDTGLSIYKQNFTTANYRFAYDLGTIGQFYRLYEGLMRHWRAVFPGAIHEIEYEALTRDPEKEIRGLLAACGLPWAPACLAFDRSAGAVTTASAVQVRRPMYSNSVGLWKKYEEHLGPLLEALGEP